MSITGVCHISRKKRLFAINLMDWPHIGQINESFKPNMENLYINLHMDNLPLNMHFKVK